MSFETISKLLAGDTPGRATEYLRAPEAGLLAYCVELGDRVEK